MHRTQFMDRARVQRYSARAAVAWKVVLFLVPVVVAVFAALVVAAVRANSAALDIDARVAISNRTAGAVDGGVRVHGEIVDLFGRLEAQGFEIWIITASNQFVAEEAADHLGIRRSRVVGIRPRVINGLLTSELEAPITYREGKLQALVQRGLQPRLVAGDSMTDYEMLRAAPTALVIDRGRIDRALMTPPTTWLVQPVNMLTLRGISN
jgi:phosphoserine phosphatase